MLRQWAPRDDRLLAQSSGAVDSWLAAFRMAVFVWSQPDPLEGVRVALASCPPWGGSRATSLGRLA